MANGTGFTGLRIAPIVVPDAATYTVKTDHTGKIHILPNLTADITITLPEAFDGASYQFQYGGAAADVQDWAITAAAGDLLLGGVVHLDTDAGSAGDEVVPVYSDATDDLVLNVLVPDAGTLVTLVSDGTSWYVNGQVVGATAPTFA